MKDSLNIVYEDEDLLVANKEPGILVEQPISEEASLSSSAASYARRSVRPLHRLDRDTSGLVMFALNAKWNRYFSELFEKKRIRKSYWAIVRGDWDGRITKIDTNIAPISPGRFGNHPSKGKPGSYDFPEAGFSRWLFLDTSAAENGKNASATIALFGSGISHSGRSLLCKGL